jgi:hypothetical protein
MAVIRGPFLGLWNFPLLNLLLAIISGLSASTLQSSRSPLVENVEEWEIIRNSEGLAKSIIVHRRVVRAQE